jgi:hypothetical protein
MAFRIKIADPGKPGSLITEVFFLLLLSIALLSNSRKKREEQGDFFSGRAGNGILDTLLQPNRDFPNSIHPILCGSTVKAITAVTNPYHEGNPLP